MQMYVFYRDGENAGLKKVDNIQRAEKFIQDKIDDGGSNNMDDYILVDGVTYAPTMVMVGEDMKVKIPF